MECPEDYHELHREIVYDYFVSIKNNRSYTLKLSKIDPTQYKTALTQFMRYGKLIRFPERIILKWKEIIMTNVCYLEAFTDIGGHSQCYPYDELNDVYETETYDYSKACELTDDEEIFPTWSNGQWFLSDYGLQPLAKIVRVLIDTTNVNEILVLINKALDVSHQRSDLSELFIKGGYDSLSAISN